MYSVNVLWFFTIGVSSFGNPRIEAYLQLPAAYRSLSRPSSAPDAKAFTLCSCSLELPSFASIQTDTCALIVRSVRFSFVLTWIAWVSLKHGFSFAAKRGFLLALFRFASLISQCWQNCTKDSTLVESFEFSVSWILLPFDWKDLISRSLSKSRFVFVLSICFFILNFSLYSIFNEHEALASWTPTHILSDVWLSSFFLSEVVGTMCPQSTCAHHTVFCCYMVRFLCLTTFP